MEYRYGKSLPPTIRSGHALGTFVPGSEPLPKSHYEGFSCPRAGVTHSRERKSKEGQGKTRRGKARLLLASSGQLASPRLDPHADPVRAHRRRAVPLTTAGDLILLSARNRVARTADSGISRSYVCCPGCREQQTTGRGSGRNTGPSMTGPRNLRPSKMCL